MNTRKNEGSDKAPVVLRVLVVVRGGVAEVLADNGVEVRIVDYDNEPTAVIPARYRDMLPVCD